MRLFPFDARQWVALIGVVIATSATVAIAERGRWPLGLFVSPRLATREFAIGAACGVALIGTCASLIALTTDVRHVRGTGFPWRELVVVFLPAVFHEELLFRGYPYQKLRRWNPTAALFIAALLFALLHGGNSAVTPLALGNIFLGGLLLGLAYDRFERLWFPIGLHLAWNLTAGPILGDEVSGYFEPQSVLVERGSGAVWLTGGHFGIEGSAWMTLVELLGIAALRISSRRRTFAPPPDRSQIP